MRIILIGLILCADKAFSQLPPPQNIRASAAYDGALIRFDPVDKAVAYLGVLGAEESSSVESSDPQLYFGDLTPLTDYTVFITAIDIDGVDGEPGFLSFRTGVGVIENFKVVSVSSTLINVQWDPVEGVESYIIDPVEDTSRPPIILAYMNVSDDTPSLPTVSMTTESTARIANLKPMTYYKVVIRGVVDTNLGPSATIRARTDGNGLVIYNVWREHNDVIKGGTGAIFKPLQRPEGRYSLSIEFPCELERFEVWDAAVDNTTSNPPTFYGLVQEELWMQEKNEVGFNFYNFFNESIGPTCDFDPNSISFAFGIDAVLPEDTEEYAISYNYYDWGDGGMLTLNISDDFRETRQAADEFDTRLPKPDRNQMAFRMKLGSNCSFIEMKNCWNVDRVYNVTIEGDGDDTYYFVQTRDMWFTNNVGFIITYDTAECRDREGFIISLLSGGNLVKSLQNTYELQGVSRTCSDDPFRDPAAIIADESMILFR